MISGDNYVNSIRSRSDTKEKVVGKTLAQRDSAHSKIVTLAPCKDILRPVSGRLVAEAIGGALRLVLRVRWAVRALK